MPRDADLHGAQSRHLADVQGILLGGEPVLQGDDLLDLQLAWDLDLEAVQLEAHDGAFQPATCSDLVEALLGGGAILARPQLPGRDERPGKGSADPGRGSRHRHVDIRMPIGVRRRRLDHARGPLEGSHQFRPAHLVNGTTHPGVSRLQHEQGPMREEPSDSRPIGIRSPEGRLRYSGG